MLWPHFVAIRMHQNYHSLLDFLFLFSCLDIGGPRQSSTSTTGGQCRNVAIQSSTSTAGGQCRDLKRGQKASHFSLMATFSPPGNLASVFVDTKVDWGRNTAEVASVG